MPAIAGLGTVADVAAPDSAAPAQIGAIASLSSATTLSAAIASGPTTGAPADESEAKVAAPAAQQTDGTGQQAASSAALDLLTTVPSATSPPPANGAAPDQNAPSAPILPPIIISDAIKPAAAAALSPPPGLISVAAESQVPPETAGNPSAPRDAGSLENMLPAQVAVRFAAPAHTDDDTTSDSGTNLLGGAGIGAMTPPGSSTLPGAALAPSFTGILSTMQSAPGAMPAPQHAVVASDAVPLAAVPIAIVTRAEAGERKFEIRLDPPDLGRIDVQLNVDSSGRATSHLVVDRADTLDLLRRDAPVLERALQSAGLTTDSGSLQFSLRDQSFAGRNQGTPAPLAPPTPATAGESDVAPLDAAVRRYGAAAGLGGGIDIRV
ncbi:MAG: flagellar hook-length control protein FliK [Alphaproteobacteria bacterium]|nr:flagellar hook-length control protein FliK [Alphaproteobacteria bacterium]